MILRSTHFLPDNELFFLLKEKCIELVNLQIQKLYELGLSLRGGIVSRDTP